MIDANARYMPKGVRFFLEIHGLDTDSILSAMGVSNPEILVAEKLTEGNCPESSMFRVWVGNTPIVYRLDMSCNEWDFLVYSGRTTGEGFICEFRKAQALQVLGGQWDVE